MIITDLPYGNLDNEARILKMRMELENRRYFLVAVCHSVLGDDSNARDPQGVGRLYYLDEICRYAHSVKFHVTSAADRATGILSVSEDDVWTLRSDDHPGTDAPVTSWQFRLV